MKRRLGKLILFAVALGSSTLASAQQAADPPSWYWPHMWGGGWGMWWFFPLLMCLFMIAMCVAMFFAMSRGGGHPHRATPWQAGDPAFSAIQLLNERFARGEIQKQEYEDKKATIVSGDPR